jgi:hypothetical protein
MANVPGPGAPPKFLLLGWGFSQLPITKKIVRERGPNAITVAERFHFSDAISITKRYFTSLRNMRS